MNRPTIYISDRERNLARSAISHPNPWVRFNLYRRLGQLSKTSEGARLAYQYVSEIFNESGFRKRWVPKSDRTEPIQPNRKIIEKLAQFFSTTS